MLEGPMLVNGDVIKPTKAYKFGHEYLYAILRGEAEYDPQMVRIATKLVDFELPKRVAVANVNWTDDMKHGLERARAARLKVIENQPREVKKFVRRF